MPHVIPNERLWQLVCQADEIGIRLEIVGGQTSWELSPGMLHQTTIDRVRATIQKGQGANLCDCLHVADLYIQFPDESVKRPDISIFCKEPVEQEGFVYSIPEAVIEVISRGFEAKDLETGPPFYLGQGVKDVVVLDPRSKRVVHFRAGSSLELSSPAFIELECGCTCTV